MNAVATPNTKKRNEPTRKAVREAPKQPSLTGSTATVGTKARAVSKRQYPTRATSSPSQSASRVKKTNVPPPSEPVDAAPAPQPVVVLSRHDALKIIVERANAGNVACLTGLRTLLDGDPAIWQEAGDLAKYAEAAWLKLLGEGDVLLVESAKRFVSQLKADLKGSAATPLEQLLISQVGVTWLATQYAEFAAAQPGQGRLSVAGFRLKQAESAGKRHLAAIKTLAIVRSIAGKS